MRENTALGELIHFSIGNIPSRIGRNIPEEMLYSLDDFDRDLAGCAEKQSGGIPTAISEKGIYTESGDCIISLARSKAGIIGNATAGKLLTANFMKCDIDRKQLDAWYFCYLFNESESVRQQMKRLQQGTTVSCISRLNISSVESIRIRKETLEKQQKIGSIYKEILIQQYLMKKQMENMKKMSLEIIRQIENR